MATKTNQQSELLFVAVVGVVILSAFIIFNHGFKQQELGPQVEGARVVQQESAVDMMRQLQQTDTAGLDDFGTLKDGSSGL